jgi:CheY-like chemotaxis protein
LRGGEEPKLRRSVIDPITTLFREPADTHDPLSLANAATGEPMTTSARNVLVVDDEALIAMLIEDMLLDLGCKVVGPAYQVGDAVALAREAEIDCAILDLNLDGKPTLAVARVLRARKIPFIFASGYAASELGGDFDDVPVLQKPFTALDIASAIAHMSRPLAALDADAEPD